MEKLIAVRALPALQRGDGVASRHLAVPTLSPEARLLRRGTSALRRRGAAAQCLVLGRVARALWPQEGQEPGDHQDEQHRQQHLHAFLQRRCPPLALRRVKAWPASSATITLPRDPRFRRIGCNEEDDSDGGCPRSGHRTRSVMAARSEAKFPHGGLPVHARPVLVAAVLGLFIATSAGAAVDAGSSVGFRFLPKKTFQGQPASLSVIARPSGVRCVPTIRYADGALQTLKPTVARGNRATWTFKIPAKARIGSATRHGQVRSRGQDHPELRRRRAARGARQGRGQEERLLTASALHSARRQLRRRALQRLA